MIPLPLLGRWATADAASVARRASRLPDRARRAAAAATEPTPYEVVYSENAVELRHYEARGDAQQDVPVVLVYALVNQPSILDLEPDRSVVGQFLDRGFDVFLVDWGDPSRLDAALTLGDYVVRFLDGCVDAVRSRTAVDGVHLLGFSTSSPLCVMYAALFPEAVVTLGLQGPPIDFDVEGGLFDFRKHATRSDPERIVDVFGTVPAELLDLGFALRKPVEYSLGRPVRFWDALDDAPAVEREARLSRWRAGGVDMPGGVYRQFVEDLLVGNKLVENRLVLDGRLVDLGNVDAPVALLLAADDDFVPHASSLPLLDSVASDDTEVFEFPTGHVGTFVDRTAHDVWWPRVCAWFSSQTGDA